MSPYQTRTLDIYISGNLCDVTDCSQQLSIDVTCDDQHYNSCYEDECDGNRMGRIINNGCSHEDEPASITYTNQNAISAVTTSFQLGLRVECNYNSFAI